MTILIGLLVVLVVLLIVVQAAYLKRRRRILEVMSLWGAFNKAEQEGDVAGSQAIVEQFISRAAGEPNATNLALNARIHRGRYHDALRIARPTDRMLLHDPSWRPFFIDLGHLVQVNLAEAEYNLGRWREALARLEALAPHLDEMQPLTRAGLAQQRAWILAHLGRHDEAAAALAVANRDDLPAAYHAEWHYTRGVLALLAGDPQAADGAFQAGLACAVRPSSERNGLFLRARARAALGDHDEAEALFGRAAEHAYRHQGGDGLLAWGDLRAQAGRLDDARRAWELACARDPESASAAVARERLGAPAPG